MSALAITGGRVVRPDRIEPATVLVEDGLIAAIGKVDVPADARRIDARGALVAPGLVDVGAFAIDPAACTAGGITRIALMPDQTPPLDHAALVARAGAAGKPDLWVHPIAAATRGLAGTELAELGLMKAAGACAVATGRGWIADTAVMHRLLAYATALDLAVIVHAEDGHLARGAVATSGEIATRLGLAAAPAEAEAIAVARDILLAEATGARLHFRQLTTARAFDLVRAAKRRGVAVTCGIGPAHLFLSDLAIGAFRTFARLSPPLRSEGDRQAALAAVADGTVDLLCSAHDPRGPEAKRLPFADAAPGMAGAESLLALSMALVRDGLVDEVRLFDLLAGAPARLLGLPAGRLEVGAAADLAIVDADAPWRIDSERMVAKAGNTPFDGLPVQGRVRTTIKGGRLLSAG